MAPVIQQLEAIEHRVMDGLKDFQKATVNRIDELFRNGTRRVLVSDEVGLGKTLVARGVIAKFARWRRDEKHDDLVKVVYVCSNAAIAEQNLNKLRISQEIRQEPTGNSRLSMQHLNIFSQEFDEAVLNSYIQLIPMTPATSFRVEGRNAGTRDERALMFAFLRRLPEFEKHLKALEELMKKEVKSWKEARDSFEQRVLEVDARSEKKYISNMLDRLWQELKKPVSKNEKMTYEDELLAELAGKQTHLDQNSRKVIGHLRRIFAGISLDRLEPDLVIMDEFQRFHDLLTADAATETGMLTEKLFNAQDVHILLLSGTPYKLYTTLEEMDEAAHLDENYQEFLEVMKFLKVTDASRRSFKDTWQEYSTELRQFSLGKTSVPVSRKSVENALYGHICRTERILEKENADIIDDSGAKTPTTATEQDVKSYIEAQHVMKAIGSAYNIPVDYVKSAPYLFSFMKDYQLKKDMEDCIAQNPDKIRVAHGKNLWLKRPAFDRYEKIPANNARLEVLADRVFSQNSERLLWVPPSRPYYEMTGVFMGTENFTKTLVFSKWEMVPRMISCMLSYEAERRNYMQIRTELAKNGTPRELRYFAERRYPQPRMNFTVNRKDGRLSGMALFCLLYPSRFLSDVYDPIDCMNRKLALQDIKKEIKKKIRDGLNAFEPSRQGTEGPGVAQEPEKGSADQSWYYLAPMLLDRKAYARKWLQEAQTGLTQDTAGGRQGKDGQTGYARHLEELNRRYTENAGGNGLSLGRQPDDLADVLCDMALASPAVCIRRSYGMYGSGIRPYMPTEFARAFINRMNTIESTAVIEASCGTNSESAHWRNLLTYCKQGNLQAVLDEYVHLCANGMDKKESLTEKIHRTFLDSIRFTTTQYNVDTYGDFKRRAVRKEREKDGKTNIRTNFAAAFTKGIRSEKDTNRKVSVRNAFNSPFRPFVLSSTSIGQEGLDFHNYCRRIVHWNLPANPIDLEQREGRINRFECLAIRQNVARQYGRMHFEKNIWQEMFAEASEEAKKHGCSDLTPYWGLPETPDMIRIERIVPMYPFSKDEVSYERLIRILSLYRLTLGQPRQEELLEYIFQNHRDDTEDLRKLFFNLSPFFRDAERSKNMQ